MVKPVIYVMEMARKAFLFVCAILLCAITVNGETQLSTIFSFLQKTTDTPQTGTWKTIMARKGAISLLPYTRSLSYSLSTYSLSSMLSSSKPKHFMETKILELRTEEALKNAHRGAVAPGLFGMMGTCAPGSGLMAELEWFTLTKKW